MPVAYSTPASLPAPAVDATSLKSSPSQIRTDESGKPIGLAPAANVHPSIRPHWYTFGSKTDRLTEVIARYLFLSGEGDQFEQHGRSHLRGVLEQFVEKQQQIELVFPAFPFKSPSGKKVLSDLPDLAEELLLSRLETLARAIEDEHAPGAIIRIVSDGIVYGGMALFSAFPWPNT